MNPPYTHALEFVKVGLSLTRSSSVEGVVAALLRINWMAGQGRRDFHQAWPCDVWVLPKRPSFTGDGKTDATEYAWFVWGAEYGGRWKVL